jgi:hypothetical protein
MAASTIPHSCGARSLSGSWIRVPTFYPGNTGRRAFRTTGYGAPEEAKDSLLAQIANEDLAALRSKQIVMAIVASELVQQGELRERVQRLQELFAQDLEIARIDHRLGQDWSGDSSIFVNVVLKRTAPPGTVIARLSEEIGAALLRVVRSEELGLHAYFNFVSHPENG